MEIMSSMSDTTIQSQKRQNITRQSIEAAQEATGSQRVDGWCKRTVSGAGQAKPSWKWRELSKARSCSAAVLPSGSKAVPSKLNELAVHASRPSAGRDATLQRDRPKGCPVGRELLSDGNANTGAFGVKYGRYSYRCCSSGSKAHADVSRCSLRSCHGA